MVSRVWVHVCVRGLLFLDLCLSVFFLCSLKIKNACLPPVDELVQDEMGHYITFIWFKVNETLVEAIRGENM